jgi:hypothetical protein
LAADSDVRCATDCSLGSQAFVVSIDRPPVPDRFRRCVSATMTPPLPSVQQCVSSCTANVMR